MTDTPSDTPVTGRSFEASTTARRSQEGVERWWHVPAANVLQLSLWTLRVVPAWVAYRVADVLAVLLIGYTLVHERKVGPQGRGLFRNQKIVFRDAWTPRFGRRLLVGWARHMTNLLVDFARMPLVTRKSVHRLVNVDEMFRMTSVERTVGSFCVTGHIGVWELSGFVPPLFGFPNHSVARPSGIPAVDAVITRYRTLGGQQIIKKHGALRRLRRVLAQNEVAGLVADEMNPQNPIFVPFLGTTAAMNSTLAKMHLVTKAPIVVATVHRQKGRRTRYRYRVWTVIRWQPFDDEETAVLRVSRLVNDAYSRAVLEYPEQWLWASRRFHVRPPGEVAGDDGLPPADHPVELLR